MKLIELKSACRTILEAGSWKLQYKVPKEKVGNKKSNLNNEAPCEMPNESLLLPLWGGQGGRNKWGWTYQTEDRTLDFALKH